MGRLLGWAGLGCDCSGGREEDQWPQTVDMDCELGWASALSFGSCFPFLLGDIKWEPRGRKHQVAPFPPFRANPAGLLGSDHPWPGVSPGGKQPPSAESSPPPPATSELSGTAPRTCPSHARPARLPGPHLHLPFARLAAHPAGPPLPDTTAARPLPS